MSLRTQQYRYGKCYLVCIVFTRTLNAAIFIPEIKENTMRKRNLKVTAQAYDRQNGDIDLVIRAYLKSRMKKLKRLPR